MLQHANWTALRLPLVLCILWCLFMVGLYTRGSAEKDAHTNELALIQARTLYTQILDTRAWNAAHGGVYVPESDYGEPNPWIPEEQRTLRLANGQRLVLMNPAYMSRQIGERTSMHGAAFRITSHEPLRPENRSDIWETRALTQCIEGAKEVFTLERDAQQQRYRYLGALHTQKDCLSCHGENRVGDVRGGISVSLDARPFLQSIQEQDKNLRWAFGLMGLTGILGIGGTSALIWRKRLLAEERERMKSTFLANMSHDMRTPLTGILGMTELLECPLNPEGREEALRYLQLAGATLLEMVSDITDYAALDAGQIQLAERPFDLRLTLQSCLDLFHPQCRAKNLSLHLKVEENVPPLLYGDEFRLRQALGNLIGNSIKFTERGGIRVDVRCAPTAEAAETTETTERSSADSILLFSVLDTGVGIAPQDQRRIFERFERGSAASEGYGGTGLGLSIAQDIARLMRGRLEVESELGHGSCFTLTLSFQPLPIEASPCVHKSDPVPVQRGDASVLVGEDNAITTHYLEQILTQAGYTVHTARNGHEVLDRLRCENVDLLLLDMRMPGMDGLTTARILREQERLAHAAPLPVVVLSASVSPEERTAFAALNVEAHLLKPVGARELLRGVAAVLGRYSDADSEKIAPTPEATDSEAVIFDREGALRDLDGDALLLERLCALWPQEVEVQRMELERSWQEHHTATVQRIAHAWKNSAAVLHLWRLHSLCARLEKADTEEWANLVPQVLAAEIEARTALGVRGNASPRP